MKKPAQKKRAEDPIISKGYGWTKHRLSSLAKEVKKV